METIGLGAVVGFFLFVGGVWRIVRAKKSSAHWDFALGMVVFGVLAMFPMIRLCVPAFLYGRRDFIGTFAGTLDGSRYELIIYSNKTYYERVSESGDKGRVTRGTWDWSSGHDLGPTIDMYQSSPDITGGDPQRSNEVTAGLALTYGPALVLDEDTDQVLPRVSRETPKR